MAYIPVPGDKNDKKNNVYEKPNPQKKEENKKRFFSKKKEEKEIIRLPQKNESIVDEKPKNENLEKNNHTQERQTKENKSNEKIVKENFFEKIPKEKKPPSKKNNPIKLKGGLLLIFIIVSIILSSIFSFSSFIQYRLFQKQMSDQYKTLTKSVNNQLDTLKKAIEEDRRFLGPDGIIDKYIIAKNSIDKLLFGLDEIVTFKEADEFKDVGFFRIFVSGAKPIWITVSDGTRRISKTYNPGLSKERFYYYKKPKTAIEGTTYEIGQNITLDSGNFEFTYIVFYNFNSTKIVRMDTKVVNNIISKYSIWLPR